MKKVFLVLLNFTLVGSLFADLTLVQRVQSSGVMGQDVTTHMELVSVSYDSIPDSVFVVPPQIIQ